MLRGIEPRLVELGKIKIGCKEETVRKSSGGGEWRAPKKLDHFLVTTLQRDARGDLEVDGELMAALGANTAPVRTLPIAVLSDDIDEILLARHCRYTSKRLSARCDGETCVWLSDDRDNVLPEPRVTQCTGEHEGAGWKTHATLNVVITAGIARWGGVYRFRTTSEISLSQLYGSLLQLQRLTGGVLQGLPLQLVMRPMQVNPVVNGKQISSTIYVVHVELRGVDLYAMQKLAMDQAAFRLQNARQLRATQVAYTRLLTAPGEAEADDEQADAATEWHPGPQNATPPGTPVPASPPPVASPPIDWPARIAACADRKALRALAAELRASFPANHPDRKAMLDLYNARDAALKPPPTPPSGGGAPAPAAPEQTEAVAEREPGADESESDDIARDSAAWERHLRSEPNEFAVAHSWLKHEAEFRLVCTHAERSSQTHAELMRRGIAGPLAFIESLAAKRRAA